LNRRDAEDTEKCGEEKTNRQERQDQGKEDRTTEAWRNAEKDREKINRQVTKNAKIKTKRVEPQRRGGTESKTKAINHRGTEREEKVACKTGRNRQCDPS